MRTSQFLSQREKITFIAFSTESIGKGSSQKESFCPIRNFSFGREEKGTKAIEIQ